MESCQHLREVEDLHEGTIVCVDCGLVKDQYFTHNFSKDVLDQPAIASQSKCLSGTILDKVNLAEYFTDFIEKTWQLMGRVIKT